MSGPDGDAAPHRLDAVVHGRVQGVGFRIHVARRADELGLTGWVGNEPGGGVRCVAEGPPTRLARLLDSLREGPAGARVDRVDETWSVATGGFDDFSIRSRGHAGD